MGGTPGTVVSPVLVATTLGSFLLGAVTTWLWHQRIYQSRRRHERQEQQQQHQNPAPRRYGGAIRLNPLQYQRYRELHDNVWDQVLERMYQSNIRNFVIYYHKETSTLYQSFEWIGHWCGRSTLSSSVGGGDEHDDNHDEASRFQRDMDAIANDPITRSWWMECEPCQIPFGQWPSDGQPPSQGGGGDGWWAPLECVCHAGHWPTAYSIHRRDPDFVKLERE